MKISEKEKPPLTIDPTAVRDRDGDTSTIRSEICLSPSWSDHGEKERKKARKLREKEKKKREEERKEAVKRARKEEEKQKAAAAKASKREGRLNKRPPPAAMETQRMPTELRRSSFISFKSGQSSWENSRPSSRERRPLSAISIGSSKSQHRSQSTPPTGMENDGAASEEWHTVVSAAAPRLPALHGIGWHSGNGSSGGSKSNSWGSDASYTKELAQFTMVTNRINRGAPGTSPQQATFNEGLRPPARPILRSQTDNDIPKVSHDSPVVKEVERALASRKGSDDRAGNDRRNSQRHYVPDSISSQAFDAQKTSQNEDTETEASAWGSRKSTYSGEQQQTLNPLQLHPIQPSSIDGSSYVHRQRMNQQQRSLAGFQEEEAVRYANRAADEEEVSPIADGQAHSVSEDEHQQEGKPALDAQEPPQDVRLSDEQPNQYHAFLKESQDVEIVKRNQQSTSKMDRILGFGRRPKPSKQSSVVTNKSGGSGGSENMVPSQLPSLEIPRQEAYNPRLSKTERIFGEPPPESASPQTPKARSKLSQAIVDKEVSPKVKEISPVHGRSRTSQAAAIVKTSPPKENGAAHIQSKSAQPNVEKSREVDNPPLVRSHSRTRTSSSQLLNDNISLSRPVQRTSTAPVLPTIKMQPFQGHNDSVAEPSKEVASPSSPTMQSTVQDRNSRVKAPRNPTGPNPPVKIVPEVVVESVNSEGIIRKTSIKRPRSNPQLQTVTPTPPMPSLDFLPQLKHQPLTKPKPRSSFVPPPNTDGSRPSSNQFPVPAAVQANAIPTSNSAPNLAPGRSWGNRPASHHALGNDGALTRLDPRRELGNRMSTLGPLSYAGQEKELDRPMAKMFVICCNCRFWHDLPSKIYEAMAVPKTLQREKGQLRNEGEARTEETTLDTMVLCPWCAHTMSTACCAGWTGVVYLHQRHH